MRSGLSHAVGSVLIGIAVSSTVHADSRAAVAATYARLPLAFEENRGQAAPQVRFLARGPGYSLLLTPTETVISLARKGQDRPAVLRMHLVESNAGSAMEGQNPLAGRMNYFLGRDPGQWRTGIPTYARVRYQDVYPGIDLIYYGNQRQLEYDFLVAPGSDPHAIRMAFESSGIPSINARGELVLHMAGGDIYQAKPVAYQEIGGVRHTVTARFVIDRKGQVGLRVGAYDRSRALVIDPYLIYSTYFGGLGADAGTGIAVDSQGFVYVAGYTDTVFPVPAGNSPPLPPGGMNGFVAKLNSDGKSLVWGAYLGGSGNDRALGIALDSTGASVYITGDTSSTDFPVLGSTQPAYGGNTDAFVARLKSDGTLSYASYLGGSAADSGAAIAVDSSGNIYVAGTTESSNFPALNAYRANRILDDTGSDGFVAKIDPNGILAYSTYLGGTGMDVIHTLAMDSWSGLIYVAGETSSSDFPEKAFQPSGITCGGGAAPVLAQPDAFVAALDLTASGAASLTFSARLGGDGEDVANGIAVQSGYVFVTGETRSSCVPYQTYGTSLNGTSDAFVAYLMAPAPPGQVSGSVYTWTYLGGSGDDRGTSIALGADFQPYVTGETNSCNFPGTAPPQSCPVTNLAFVANIPVISFPLRAYSAYLGPTSGGSGPVIAVSRKPMNRTGNIYVTGSTSGDFPTTAGALQPAFAGGDSDAFVAFLSRLAAVDQLDPPVTTPQDTPVSITLSGLPLDSCPSCPLNFDLVSPPLHGSVDWAPLPPHTLVYRPNTGYIGTDRILFTVSSSDYAYTSFPGTVNVKVLDGTPPTVTTTPAWFPPTQVAAGTNLTLTVTASDLGLGDSNIARIEYRILPADIGVGPPTDWILIGKDFGSPQATITTKVVAPTIPSLYTLEVRAQDSAGNWSLLTPPLPPPPSIPLLVYDPSISINGSGTVPVAGGSAQFDFDFKYAGKAGSPSGSLRFQSKDAGVKFQAVGAAWMGWTREGTVTRWTVMGSSLLGGADFFLYATDGNPSPDAFGLRIGSGQPFYLPSTIVTSGNITMHAK